jgi:hypothetical protein
VSSEVHALAPAEFLEQVHSFEFWFQSVEGYLADTEFGHRPAAPDVELPPDRRERLITVLCNYCIGETAALEGASGLIGFAPNRQSKIFLATQVVDEARHLEVLLHRLTELGVQDPESEIQRRAIRTLRSSGAGCSSWSRARTGRPRSSRRTSSSRRWSSPPSRPTRATPTRSRARCSRAS